jgi:glutamyl-tRNA reductase
VTAGGSARYNPPVSVYALGISHTTAPLDVRERVVFTPEVLTDALRDLTKAQHAREAAILSTCNRTEVYFAHGEPAPVGSWLERFHGLAPNALAPYVYTHRGDKAVTHAFRVASGLDSMVLGEPQILGQMKQAVRSAEAAGSLGLVLNRLFQRTFAVAKDVRTQTDIGSASISMAAASVKLAERIFPSIASQRLLLVGAGEMIELAASHFLAKTPKSVTVANRTLERGRQLADRLGATAITLQELPQRLHEFDIVVTCTASTLPIIGKGLLERVVKLRKHAPVFVVDLGVPRDVEPQAADLDDVFLYSVDELQAIVRDNLQVRQDAVVQAERMIADQTAHFLHWLDGRTVVPTIEALSGHHDDVRSHELDRARRMLNAGESPDAVLEALARGLTAKLLHAPLSALNAANETERTQLIAALSRVYRLDAPKDGEP